MNFESKFDAIIEKQNTIPKPMSSDHERPEKDKKIYGLKSAFGR